MHPLVVVVGRVISALYMYAPAVADARTLELLRNFHSYDLLASPRAASGSIPGQRWSRRESLENA